MTGAAVGFIVAVLALGQLVIPLSRGWKRRPPRVQPRRARGGWRG